MAADGLGSEAGDARGHVAPLGPRRLGHARKLATPGGHWVIWADADELDRMNRIRSCPRGWSEGQVLAQLTKPKDGTAE